MAAAQLRARKLRLLVVGKTGVGKSSLCNALVKDGSAADPFRVSPDFFSAETKGCQRVQRLVRDWHLTVVDSPGAIDTPNRGEFNPLMEIDKAMSFCPDGFHALLLLLRLDVPLTDEEKKAITQLKTFLGDGFLTFTVIVFTHGDSIENDEEKFKHKMNDCKKDDTFLNMLMRQCGDRVAMVDTSAKCSQKVLDKQLERVLSIVECKLNGVVYTGEEAKELRKFSGQKFPERQPLNVLIIGEPRSGKSTLANALMETDKFPVTKADSEPCSEVKSHEIFFLGKMMTVVEAPGVSADGAVKEKIDEAMQKCDKGFHAFIVVIRANSDLSIKKNFADALKKLRGFFSASGFISRLIVVFTFADAFYRTRDFKHKLRGARKTVASLDQLLKSGSNRIVVMDNSDKWSEEKQMEAMDDLWERIDEVVANEKGPVVKYVPPPAPAPAPERNDSWCSLL